MRKLKVGPKMTKNCKIRKKQKTKHRKRNVTLNIRNFRNI